MTIDWPTTFTGIKTVLDPLASASWPIALGGIAYGYRESIKKLIGRVKEASGFGSTIAFAPQETVTHQLESEKSNQLPAPIVTQQVPAADAVLSSLDTELLEFLDQQLPADDRLKLLWAIRIRSISETNRLHEFHYRIMFGSQIRALVALNQGGEALIDPFRQFYTQLLSDPVNAQIHKDRSFDEWGEFLINIKYVEEIEGSDPPAVRITPLGRQFCAWLGYAGAAQNKPG